MNARGTLPAAAPRSSPGALRGSLAQLAIRMNRTIPGRLARPAYASRRIGGSNHPPPPRPCRVVTLGCRGDSFLDYLRSPQRAGVPRESDQARGRGRAGYLPRGTTANAAVAARICVDALSARRDNAEERWKRIRKEVPFRESATSGSLVPSAVGVAFPFPASSSPPPTVTHPAESHRSASCAIHKEERSCAASVLSCSVSRS